MGLGEGIVLGIVQGLTEFLPISSTGHLILARELFGITTENGLAFDAVLQLATGLAVLVYFRRDLLGLARFCIGYVKRSVRDVEPERHKTLLWALIFGTLPAVVAGLLLEDYMETLFRSATLVASTLLAGSALFLLAEYVALRYAKRGVRRALTARTGCFIGLFQTLALIPGMSRAGSTISGGLLLGLSREEAARFGFLLSFPIILGSGGKKLLELFLAGALPSLGAALFLGALAALVTGVLAIHFMLKFLRRHTLLIFVVYRVALALSVFFFIAA